MKRRIRDMKPRLRSMKCVFIKTRKEKIIISTLTRAEGLHFMATPFHDEVFSCDCRSLFTGERPFLDCFVASLLTCLWEEETQRSEESVLQTKSTESEVCGDEVIYV